MPSLRQSLFGFMLLCAASAAADTSLPTTAASLVVAIPSPPRANAGLLCGDVDRAEMLRALIDYCKGEKDPDVRRGCRHVRRWMRDCENEPWKEENWSSWEIDDDNRREYYWFVSWTRGGNGWSVDTLVYQHECDED